MLNSDWPREKWVVLDTNFLIDYYSKQESYAELLEQLRKNENTISSTELVRTEFIRSRTKDVVRSKSAFFNKIVESLLPLDKEIHKLVQPTIETYGQDIEGVSLTDIYLACVIQRYRQVYLLTRDHHDFPTRLFDRTHVFLIELNKEIKTYALYQYRKPEEKKIDAEIEEIPF